jgi:hypothetical protein
MFGSSVQRTSSELIRLEELTLATTAVAMFRQEPHELSKLHPNLVFRPAYDGLDNLNFTILTLPSGESVALVRHVGCPQPGTELCVAVKPQSSAKIVKQALEFLAMTSADFIWVHPDL